MNPKVLLVDDEPHVTEAIRRNFQRRYEIHISDSPSSALKTLHRSGPFAVVVSDLVMPEMSGVQFLSVVRSSFPDVVRILLTGKAEMDDAIEAVNEGEIFRLLVKPCPPERLALAIDDGIRQHNLIKAEKELLTKTVAGVVRVLAEILALLDPAAFGKAQKVVDLVRTIAPKFPEAPLWEWEVAALLAPIGSVAVPPDVLAKVSAGGALSPTDLQMMAQIPATGHQLLQKIPRLEPVAEIVLYHRKCFDGAGAPAYRLSGDSLPLGARVLKILYDLASLEADGNPRHQALQMLAQRRGHYDPQLLQTISEVFIGSAISPPTSVPRPVGLWELREGQVLYSDLKTDRGELLVSAGHRVTHTTLRRIWNFAQVAKIREPIYILEGNSAEKEEEKAS